MATETASERQARRDSRREDAMKAYAASKEANPVAGEGNEKAYNVELTGGGAAWKVAGPGSGKAKPGSAPRMKSKGKTAAPPPEGKEDPPREDPSGGYKPPTSREDFVAARCDACAAISYAIEDAFKAVEEAKNKKRGGLSESVVMELLGEVRPAAAQPSVGWPWPSHLQCQRQGAARQTAAEHQAAIDAAPSCRRLCHR